jgi:hypothetical protein
MKNKCENWWGVKHNFGKWEMKDEGNLMSNMHNPPLRIGFWTKQERICIDCGYTETKYKEIY